jgi:hypothetical protein
VIFCALNLFCTNIPVLTLLAPTLRKTPAKGRPPRVQDKAKRDSSAAPANFFVGTKKKEKIGRLRSRRRRAGGNDNALWALRE